MLNIGKIPYANLFPIFHYLDTRCDTSEYRFIEGAPSKLNKMLHNNELDISPSSSIEYIKNKEHYIILPDFSISSTGPIKSILLFSKFPIEKLAGKNIAVSAETDTSAVLLQIILKEFMKIECTFSPVDTRSVNNILTSFSAMLHIGDNAMIEAKKQPAPYVYDLGELWYEHTGLPFVFALAIECKDSISAKKGLIEQFSKDLAAAKEFSKNNLESIATKAPQRKWLSEEELVSYWKIISYDLGKQHMEGLKLFEKYASCL